MSRRFLPSSVPALEGRVVPSAIVPSAAAVAAKFVAWFTEHAIPGGLSAANVRSFEAEVRPAHLSAGQIARSNRSEHAFGLSASETIHQGMPVAFQVTTKWTDGSIQTESLLEVPNAAHNTVTSYATIHLRNNGGTEKLVDIESFSGGTTPFSGNDNTHNVTITLPNGSTEAETYHEVITGNKTVFAGRINEAGGGTENWSTVKIKHGRTTTSEKTITEPNGTVERQVTVTTRRGDLDSTAFSTTIQPGSIQFASSATNRIRVQP
jgi:hypothetical protein